jgi:hypothetical protein
VSGFSRPSCDEARSRSEAKIRRSLPFNRWREQQLVKGVRPRMDDALAIVEIEMSWASVQPL